MLHMTQQLCCHHIWTIWSILTTRNEIWARRIFLFELQMKNWQWKKSLFTFKCINSYCSLPNNANTVILTHWCQDMMTTKNFNCNFMFENQCHFHRNFSGFGMMPIKQAHHESNMAKISDTPCYHKVTSHNKLIAVFLWPTLFYVMACCLTAPSHYLNQCWVIITEVLWH